MFFETYIAANWEKEYTTRSNRSPAISASGVSCGTVIRVLFLLSGIYLVLMSPAYVSVVLQSVGRTVITAKR